MELRQLSYFIAVAEELHYGRAAERLRISKPTLSQQLVALERSLGARLLERSARSVSLTPAGATLLVEARPLLAAAQRARDAVSAATSGERRLDLRVTVATPLVLGRQLAALEQIPGLTVNMSITDGMDAEQAVLDGRAHAALVWVRRDHHPRLHGRAVASAPVCLLMPKDHRLAGSGSVHVSDLAEERIALFARHLSPAVWDLFLEHLLPGRGPAPGQVLEVPRRLHPMPYMVRTLVENSAVTPLVEPVAEAVRDSSVVVRSLDPPLRLPLELLWTDADVPGLQEVLTTLSRRDADLPGEGSADRGR